MTRGRLAATAALALVFLIAMAGPASAHAILEATSPGDGAHLDKAPPIVTLTFSEDITAPLGAVGRKVLAGDETTAFPHERQ